MKRPEFALDPSFPRFHLHEPLHQPVLRSDPSICTRVLQPNDKFLIFASDGLWEYLTNEDAVEIVHNNPRVVRIIFLFSSFHIICPYNPSLTYFFMIFSIFFLEYQGIAKRLLISAINQACKKRRVTYNELKKYDKGVRRRVHDDITVVVIFIDHEMFENNASVPELSIRGFVDTVGPSNFNFPQGIDVKQSVLSEGCS